jgi:hypothetical protein
MKKKGRNIMRSLAIMPELATMEKAMVKAMA